MRTKLADHIKSELYENNISLYNIITFPGPFCKTLSGEVGILIKDYYYLTKLADHIKSSMRTKLADPGKTGPIPQYGRSEFFRIFPENF